MRYFECDIGISVVWFWCCGEIVEEYRENIDSLISSIRRWQQNGYWELKKRCDVIYYWMTQLMMILLSKEQWDRLKSMHIIIRMWNNFDYIDDTLWKKSWWMMWLIGDGPEWYWYVHYEETWIIMLSLLLKNLIVDNDVTIEVMIIVINLKDGYMKCVDSCMHSDSLWKCVYVLTCDMKWVPLLTRAERKWFRLDIEIGPHAPWQVWNT